MFCPTKSIKNLVLSILLVVVLTLSVSAQSIINFNTKASNNKNILNPEKIILVKLNPIITDPEKFVKSVNLLFLDNMKLSQNLFSYVSVKDKVYKLHDIDEFNSLTEKPIVYIAYTENIPLQLISNLSFLYNISDVSTAAIKFEKDHFNISESVAFSDKLPTPDLKYDLSLETNVYDYDADPGSITQIQVKIKNKSLYPLLKNDLPKVFVVSLKNDKETSSDLYINSDWYSKSRTGKLEDNRLKLDESGTFSFNVLSNVVSGKENQKFAFANYDGSIILDSQFDLNLNVLDKGQKIVEVKPNGGYGFYNIRDEKKYNGRVIAFANSGTKLMIVKDDGAWIKVKYDGNKEGWIQSAYVKKLN